MSLEMATPGNCPEVRVLYSSVAELIMLINVLADPRHHASEQEEVRILSENLSPESIQFLSKIAELPFQGIEFIEILLNCGAFDSLNEFIRVIREFDTVPFIHTMTGDLLSENQITSLMEDRQALPQRLHDLPWVYRGKEAVYESFLFETSVFKESLITLLYEINNYYSGIQEKLRTPYRKALEFLRGELARTSPYSVAEKIMNRKIEEDPNVETIFFLPSNYVNPHYIMAFSKTSRLFLYDMRKKDSEKSRANQTLTNALKVLSDSTRLEILRLLIAQPSYGKILADRLNLTTATISHHLDVLSSASLICESRSGNTKYFSADVSEIQKLIDTLNDYLYNK